MNAPQEVKKKAFEGISDKLLGFEAVECSMADWVNKKRIFTQWDVATSVGDKGNKEM